MYELLLSVHVLDKAGKTLQLVSVMTVGDVLLGSAAGHLLQVDWSEVRTRSLDFFRFKVRIHSDEPLIPGAFIELFEGDFHWIPFRYERIFRVCYKCGRIGHSNTACNSSLVDALESLHQRYNESPFSSTFPLILENNKPMFSPTLRALRNTDCNRTSRIWVLYEEEVQNMEMDQNLVFNVDITDSHSSGEIYHTPEGDPSPPIQPLGNPAPAPVPSSSSWWQSAISMFSPPIHNTSPAHTTPNLFDTQPHFSQPPTLHATTTNTPSPLPLSSSIPPAEAAPITVNQPSPPFVSQTSSLTPVTHDSHTILPPINIPSKVSEVFRCSAPDFFGDDSLPISVPLSIKPTPDTPDLSSSNAIKQQYTLSKKRSSSSSSNADSPRGGKRSKLIQLNQREQPPGPYLPRIVLQNSQGT
ncbi:hypothetical protein RHMOL_Rhmol10G0304300 [Rhododendron molle]|uniref:Uncharacterized protein n=1 Tax=Rhododendron molle TaxID=49168 RepID=A0ACC0M8D8_RHOML|nr:hypothetical protein RHMOL_Rhmol10G0304300 [Rhododendron molle]